MKCPLTRTMDWDEPNGPHLVHGDCIRAECALWNDYFGMCCKAVDAHLKAVEDSRLEREITRRGG